MKTIDESSDEPPPSARLRNTPTTIDPLLSGLGELLDAGSPALAGFLARRGKAERVSSRLLAFSRNPEQHTERFLATWRAHPHLALKIAYHGTKAQNVSSICASGLRPAHAGGAAFLGATITKAISYCDWRLAPDFQPHDPSEKWCPTGVVVVCALLVDPHPSDAAATTALSSETKPAASKTSSSSAFESPNFVGNDAGEIWPPAPNSTVALHEDDFAKHLPLGVMAVTSQPLIDHERDGPSASIAKLLKLRTAALAPERQATEAAMTAAAAAAEQAAAFAEQMAEKAAEAEAAAVAEAERLAAAAPAATATPPLAVTQRPLKELSIINEGSMEHGSMIEGSAAWEATSYEAELERKARAAGARARAAERLRMKQAREEQAQQALEESASQLFENEERRALADARAHAARERAAERVQALSDSQVREDARKQALKWASAEKSEAKAAEGRARARDRVRASAEKHAREAESAAASAAAAAEEAAANAAEAGEEAREARREAAKRVQRSKEAAEAEAARRAEEATSGQGSFGEDPFWAEKALEGRRRAEEANAAKMAASKARAAARAAEAAAAEAQARAEQRAYAARQAVEAAEAVAVAESRAILAVMAALEEPDREARQRSVDEALYNAGRAVRAAAVEAAAAQEAEEAAVVAAEKAVLALKAEKCVDAHASRWQKSGKKRMVDWRRAAEEAEGATKREVHASAATARGKEAAVLAAVAAEETIEAMAHAWSAGGEAHAKEAGRRRVKQLEASLTHARAAAKAVADDARQHHLPPLQEEPES